MSASLHIKHHMHARYGIANKRDRNTISYVIWNAPKREDTTQRVSVMWTGLTGEGVGL